MKTNKKIMKDNAKYIRYARIEQERISTNHDTCKEGLQRWSSRSGWRTIWYGNIKSKKGIVVALSYKPLWRNLTSKSK